MEQLSDYDYLLPDELIAQKPLEDRAASKLLWLDKSGRTSHRIFRELDTILETGDLLVLNDARVTALRIFGAKPTGAAVELLLLREESPGVYWALAKPGRRLGMGAQLGLEGGIRGMVTAIGPAGERRIAFDLTPGLGEALRRIGATPLPPYIRGRIDDPERYQTVYSRSPGSSAAPTAGLHFTEELLSRLQENGIETAYVRLDVGLDTFRPVEEEDPSKHPMHGESCCLPQATADAVRNCKGRVIAVGTTSVRTLESFATGRRRLEPGSMTSTLFIRPGFEFQVVDGLITNFHLPRTTMLMLVSALAGREALFGAYREAIQRNYRFLSFGDAMIVL